jgi:hypothetical protein
MGAYKNYLICEGPHYSAYFHSDADGSSDVYDYFARCDRVTQAGLLYLVKRMCDCGKIFDITKFRMEDPDNRIFVFKPGHTRFFCFFFVNKEIIITSAHHKWRRRLDRRELRKAVLIKNMYI